MIRATGRGRRTISALLPAVALACVPASAPAATATFKNENVVTIPDSGAASPYPLNIPVTGLRGPLQSVDVTTQEFTHTFPDDVDVLGVAPSGRTGMVFSDACGSGDLMDATWHFTPSAFGALTDTGAVSGGSNCASGDKTNGVFRGDGGTGFDTTDFFPATGSPAPPAPPYGQSPSELAEGNPNGTWRFYVSDDAAGGSGDIGKGVKIDLTYGTSYAALPAAAPTPTVGKSSPYPLTSTISALPAHTVVTDLNVVFDGVYHSFPSDLDLLLAGPQGQTAVLMSDACGSTDASNAVWRWDDEAAAAMPSAGCPDGSYRPTNTDEGGGGDDSWPGLPAGSYGSDLSVFDYTDPTGTWRLFAVDDVGSDEGFLTNPFRLELTTRVAAEVSFASPITIAEGGSGEVTVQRSADPPLGPATVRVRSTPGTALSSDFPAIDTTVNFAPGETTKTVTVGSVDDDLTEQSEQYRVTLSAPTRDAAIAATPSTEVTIAANDQPGQAADTTPPETTIDKGPAKRTAKHKAKFQFSASETPATFECALDRDKFKPCTSPAKYKGLGGGKHTFFVRATDAAGNADPTPAKLKWKVT
jgi:hypothetical protein